MQLSRDIENAKHVDPQWTARFTRWAREAEALEADNSRLREALAFAASVIRSGEPWTATCEQVIGGALKPAA